MTPRRGADPGPSGSAAEARLRIDPVACDGIGLCALLAPDVIDLDRWGFPVVERRDLTPGEVPAARGAVRACPRRALWLESVTNLAAAR